MSNRNEKIDTLNDLFRYRIISFAGIANATPMINYLKEYASEVRHLPFDDHHEYSPKDLEDIRAVLARHPNVDRERIRRSVSEFAELLGSPELLDVLASLLNKTNS